MLKRMKKELQNRLQKYGVVLSALFLFSSSYAQLSTKQLNGTFDTLNTITTAVPFLIISPDARAGGMGDAGVATSADANAIHWNASKLAFSDKNMGFAMSTTPWLRNLGITDIYLAYLTGYKKIGKDQAIAGSLRYFTLGKIQFTDIQGQNTIQANPNEFAIDVAYSRKLSDYFSGGMALRYINSNLTNGQQVLGQDSRAGQAVAADISSTYRNPDIKIGDKKSIFTSGINISNIGNKISYTSSQTKNFLPINLRLGSALTMNLDEFNSLTFLFDMNKLLVPTPPRYGDPKDPTKITAGKDPNRGVVNGMLLSFNDAPNGGKEEFKEIIFCGGMEYWYDKLFAFRMGYFYEAPSKGNRKYLTFGAGLRYNVFGLDFSYIATQQQNPLKNTLRFTLLFDLAAFKSQNAEKPTE